MADALLVDQRSKVFQRLLSSIFCKLLSLFRRHCLLQLSEIPMDLRFQFLGVKWNKHVELNPFVFRVWSDPAASASNVVDF